MDFAKKHEAHGCCSFSRPRALGRQSLCLILNYFKLIWERNLLYSKIHYIQASNKVFHLWHYHGLYHMTPHRNQSNYLTCKAWLKEDNRDWLNLSSPTLRFEKRTYSNEETIGGRERSQKMHTEKTEKRSHMGKENWENRVGTIGKTDTDSRHFIQMLKPFFIRRNYIQLFVLRPKDNGSCT